MEFQIIILKNRSLWAHAFGLPNKWESFQPDFARCQLQYNKQGFEVKTQNMRLKLKQFYPAFGLMAFGYLISLAIFICQKESII